MIGTKSLRVSRAWAFRFGVAAILAAALGVRLAGLAKGIWLDEAFTLPLCRADDLLDWIRAYLTFNHAPAYALLVTAWSRVNDSVPFLRLLSVLLGVATVWVAMRWLLRYSPSAALAGGLMTALSPYLIAYSQEIRPYPLMMLSTALSFHAAANLAKHTDRGRASMMLGLALGLVAFTHFTGVVLVPVVGLYLILSVQDRRRLLQRDVLAALLLPLACGVLLQLVQARWIARFTGDWWMPSFSPDLAWRAALLLAGMPVTASPDGTGAVLALVPPAVAAVAVTLAFLGLWRGDWRRSLPLLAAAVAYWGIIVVYSVTVMPVFWKQTVLPGLVPFVGFLAVQADSVRPLRLRAATLGLLGLAAATGAVVWLAVGAGRPIERWDEVGRLIDSRWRHGDAVVVVPGYAERPVRFYASRVHTSALVPIRVPDNEAGIGARLDETSRIVAVPGRRMRLILVIRVDLVARRHVEQFRALASAVRARADRFELVETLIVVSDTSMVPELSVTAGEISAMLDASWGRPVTVERRDGYQRRICDWSSSR